MAEVDIPVQVTDWTPSEDLRPVAPAVLIVDTLPESLELDEMRSGIADLVSACRASGVPVVFVAQITRPEFHSVEPQARPEEYVIRRHRFSSFYGTELDLVLRGFGARTVVLVGGASDVQVHYTAVDAHQHDYHIRVVTDLVTSTGPKLHEAALRAIKYLQRDALVSSRAVHDWLGTLAPDAGSIELDIVKENA